MTLCIIWEQRSAILAHSSTCLFIILRFQRKDLNLSKVWKKVGIVPIIEIMNDFVHKHLFSGNIFVLPSQFCVACVFCCLCVGLLARNCPSAVKGRVWQQRLLWKEFWDYSEIVWLRERLECDQEKKK